MTRIREEEEEAIGGIPSMTGYILHLTAAHVHVYLIYSI